MDKLVLYQNYKLIFNKILKLNYTHNNNKQQKNFKNLKKQKMIKY